jgi:hypothetical protein
MPYATATLDGNAIFGLAVKIQHVLRPSVNDLAEFFGINGLFSNFGGTRGRILVVEGVLIGQDIPSLNLNEGTFETYVDGAAHILTDSRGRAWSNVIFQGDFQPDPRGPAPLVGYYNGDGSQWWALPYRAAFLALN